MKEQFHFNVSLSTLNNLGRNLYRNIITIIGEAISNSWDADAKKVLITIDRAENSMMIVDDGYGMTASDFQDKFLKIGYSKRKIGSEINSSSKLNRPFIGRKGIGKLALLSCSQTVHLLSKTETTNYTGGVIDNSDLDMAISEDKKTEDYILGSINDKSNKLKDAMNSFKSGTGIYFEKLQDGIFNTPDYLKTLIALNFQFSLFDKDFLIFVNDKKVTYEDLSDFADKTQFLWTINEFDNEYIQSMHPLEIEKLSKKNVKFKGYVASVEKPSNLKIRGTNEKLTIDLFVNGRLRKKDILENINTARIPENYLYGQIHYNELDFPEKDIFTSNREGILPNEKIMRDFTDDFEKILNDILNQWDKFRLKHKYDGDPENERKPLEQRKIDELMNVILNKTVKVSNKDISLKTIIDKNAKVKKWTNKLTKEAQFNIDAYSECFILENLMRYYIKDKNISLTTKINLIDKYKKIEDLNKNRGNISFDIRKDNDDIFYLETTDFAELIELKQNLDIKSKTASLLRSAEEYTPIRNAVAHTSIITNIAKKRLTTIYENIKARLLELLNEI